MPSLTPWPVVLDALEAWLDALAARRGDELLTPPPPLVPDGPLPAELLARALAVLGRVHRSEVEVTGQLASLTVLSTPAVA